MVGGRSWRLGLIVPRPRSGAGPGRHWSMEAQRILVWTWGPLGRACTSTLGTCADLCARVEWLSLVCMCGAGLCGCAGFGVNASLGAVWPPPRCPTLQRARPYCAHSHAFKPLFKRPVYTARKVTLSNHP
eukprot:362876-Chlamydomonas_euryale.AAC.1